MGAFFVADAEEVNRDLRLEIKSTANAHSKYNHSSFFFFFSPRCLPPSRPTMLTVLNYVGCIDNLHMTSLTAIFNYNNIGKLHACMR